MPNRFGPIEWMLRPVPKTAAELADAYGNEFLLALDQEPPSPKESHLQADLRPDSRILALRTQTSASPWQSISVGRHESCDVVISHPSVSRHHATFERDPVTMATVLFCRSTLNGTRIDGVSVAGETAHTITCGCRIELGRASFLYLSAKGLFDLLMRSDMARSTGSAPRSAHHRNHSNHGQEIS